MTPLGPVYWLFHGALLIAGSALTWGLAVALHRALRWSPADRSFWLGAIALAVLPAALALLLSVVAPGTTPPVLAPMGDLGAGLADGVADGVATATALLPAASWSLWLLLAYLVGVAWCFGRRIAAHLRLRRLLRAAAPLPAAALPGARSREVDSTLRRRGIALRVTAQPVSPFALGWPRNTIVVPQALLKRLDDRQLSLVLRHEAAHLAHRDPLLMAALWLLTSLLWFDPFLRALQRRLQLACELCCDARVLAAEKTMRRAYAEAYLETLRMSMARALPCPATAFSPHDQGSHTMRITHILHGDRHAGKRPFTRSLLAATALLAGVGLGAVHARTATADTAEPEFRGPIINGRISSHFGHQRPELSRHPHRGIDLVAARGTPVRAPAAGTVVSAETVFSQATNYGSVVVLDHGGGWQTLYAHLDRIDVAVGDRVALGEPIGGLGSSGKATGPHVHVEVHHNGQRLDPASVIATPVGRP